MRWRLIKTSKQLTEIWMIFISHNWESSSQNSSLQRIMLLFSALSITEHSNHKMINQRNILKWFSIAKCTQKFFHWYIRWHSSTVTSSIFIWSSVFINTFFISLNKVCSELNNMWMYSLTSIVFKTSNWCLVFVITRHELTLKISIIFINCCSLSSLREISWSIICLMKMM